MLVGRGNGMLGFIGVEDQPRAESRAALAELHALDSRMKTVMLTGDHRNVAESVAAQIGGLDEIRAGLLPEDKLRVIRQLQAEGSVAMIGDGINDAPALAQADIGIAMGGGGTAQAMETADVVLMQDDLHSIPLVLRVSRQTRRVVQQNITLSLVLKLAVLGPRDSGYRQPLAGRARRRGRNTDRDAERYAAAQGALGCHAGLAGFGSGTLMNMNHSQTSAVSNAPPSIGADGTTL